MSGGSGGVTSTRPQWSPGSYREPWIGARVATQFDLSITPKGFIESTLPMRV